MRRGVFATVVVAVGLLVAGCGPESGTVVERKYVPESTYTQMTTIDGKSWWPMVNTSPEQWELLLDGDGDRGWRSVSEAEYEACGVGEHFPECALEVK